MIELVEHRDAFECLFRENYTRLFYHAFSFLNDEEEAKDVVNDVFERVWMNFEKLEFSSSLVPLLYTLVRNRCVSLIRHKKVKERFSREIEVELEGRVRGVRDADRKIASFDRIVAGSNEERV